MDRDYLVDLRCNYCNKSIGEVNPDTDEVALAFCDDSHALLYIRYGSGSDFDPSNFESVQDFVTQRDKERYEQAG